MSHFETGELADIFVIFHEFTPLKEGNQLARLLQRHNLHVQSKVADCFFLAGQVPLDLFDPGRDCLPTHPEALDRHGPRFQLAQLGGVVLVFGHLLQQLFFDSIACFVALMQSLDLESLVLDPVAQDRERVLNTVLQVVKVLLEVLVVWVLKEQVLVLF